MSVVSNWLMCGRKKKFETKAKANKTGKNFSQRPYLCPICGTWHLTKYREEIENQ